MNNTVAIQELVFHVWEFLQKPYPITPVSNSSVVDFIRARLLLASCENLESENSLKQYLSNIENEELLKWAIKKMQDGELKSILAISSRIN